VVGKERKITKRTTEVKMSYVTKKKALEIKVKVNLRDLRLSSLCKYDGVSKIFRTDAAIYTAVMVARSTGRW
jgi:hypothetical protein